jgi:hypothetical protein
VETGGGEGVRFGVVVGSVTLGPVAGVVTVGAAGLVAGTLWVVLPDDVAELAEPPGSA